MGKQNATFTPFPASFPGSPPPMGILKRGLSQDKKGNKCFGKETQLGSSRKCGSSDYQFDSLRIIQPFLFYLFSPLVHLLVIIPSQSTHWPPLVSMMGHWFFQNSESKLFLPAWCPSVTLTWVPFEHVSSPSRPVEPSICLANITLSKCPLDF